MRKRFIARNVFFMGLVSFFTDVHSEIILPLLPLFLIETIGISRAFLGLIEGVADTAASLLKVASGWLSDRIRRRKPLVVMGYFLSTLAKPFLSLAQTGTHVLFIRFSDRIGKGIRTSPRDAMIADSCDEDERGRSFGFHRMMDTCGAAVGATFAFLLMVLLSGNYRRIFLLATVFGIIAVVLAKFFVQELKPTALPPERRPSLSLLSLPAQLKSFLIVATIFSLGNFSYAFFILGANGLGVAAKLIPLVYLLYNLSYAAVAIPAGILSDRYGRRPLLVSGYFAFSVLCLGFAFAKARYLAWLLFIFYGIHSGIVVSISRAYVSDLVDSSRRATALGFYHTLVGLAVLPASLIAGALWDKVGKEGCFLYGAVLSTVAALGLLYSFRRS